MKIIVKEKNDSLIEFNVSMLWKDIEEDYDNELNKVLSNVKEKGARKGKLKGIQRELFIKNNKFKLSVSILTPSFIGICRSYTMILSEYFFFRFIEGFISR